VIEDQMLVKEAVKKTIDMEFGNFSYNPVGKIVEKAVCRNAFLTT